MVEATSMHGYEHYKINYYLNDKLAGWDSRTLTILKDMNMSKEQFLNWTNEQFKNKVYASVGKVFLKVDLLDETESNIKTILNIGGKN